MITAKAIFAAGCFWGVQALFDSLPGVISTEVGYTGGKLENPSYQDVCADSTGHAEAVKIEYNPQKISYNQLLNVFFSGHNPTTLNRQGPDIGTQYRSAIFYENENQKTEALNKIKELEQNGKFTNKIVTEVVPVSQFYPAEEYHQKYLQKQGKTNCKYNSLKNKTNEEWQKELTPEQFKILRLKETEYPGSGKYNLTFENGLYKCAACGNPLFTSSSKFKSSSGWPSFNEAIPNSVEYLSDTSHGMNRIEVTCAKCGGHLGHVFQDMPGDNPNRYCINSISLDFEKSDK